jgi:hypothetical protein
MEDTLKRLGHKFAKTNEGLSIDRPYYPIYITEQEISCDSMHCHEIDGLKSEYQKDFQIHERTVRGEQFEVTETKDEIVIMVH